MIKRLRVTWIEGGSRFIKVSHDSLPALLFRYAVLMPVAPWHAPEAFHLQDDQVVFRSALDRIGKVTADVADFEAAAAASDGVDPRIGRTCRKRPAAVCD